MTPYKILDDKCDKLLTDFHFEDFINKHIANRIDGSGEIQASKVLVEIADIIIELLNEDPNYPMLLVCAYHGWQLYTLHGLSQFKLKSRFDKIVKQTHKEIKKNGANVSVNNVAFLMFLGMKIKDRYYKNINLLLSGFEIKPDEYGQLKLQVLTKR